MDPGAVLLALLGSAEPGVARMRSSTQYDSTVGADTVAGPGRGAAVLRVKGTTKALVATTDGNQARRRARSVARRGAGGRRGDAQRVDHRRPAAGRHELPQLRRPDAAGGVLAAAARASAASATRAARSGLPVTGGNVSLYNESPTGAIAPTARDRRRRACSTTSRRSSGRPSCDGDDVVAARRRDRAGPGRLGLRRRSPAPPPRTSRRRSTSRARRRCRRSSARRSRAGCVRVGPGRVGRRARGRPRRGRDVGRARRRRPRWRSPTRPAVDLFGEGPSRLVVTLPAAATPRR